MGFLEMGGIPSGILEIGDYKGSKESMGSLRFRGPK